MQGYLWWCRLEWGISVRWVSGMARTDLSETPGFSGSNKNQLTLSCDFARPFPYRSHTGIALQAVELPDYVPILPRSQDDEKWPLVTKAVSRNWLAGDGRELSLLQTDWSWARLGSTGFRRRFRRRFRFREALVQDQVRFNRVPEKVVEKVWEALVQSQVRFNRVPEKVLEKVPVPGGFGAEPGQVQQGSGGGSGEGLGGFGAEPRQVQQGSEEGGREGSGEGLRRRFRWRSGRLWCKSGSTGSGEGCRSQARSGSFNSWKPAEVFPALGFPARFRKICKNNTLRLLRIPPKLKLDSFVFPQQQNFAMGFLAQIISGAIRCSFNTRFWTRFRGVLVQIPREVPEGSGADTLWGSGRFRCRDLVRFRGFGEVPEGSGADSLWGSGEFWCRCFVKVQRVPIFFLWHKHLIFMA